MKKFLEVTGIGAGIFVLSVLLISVACEKEKGPTGGGFTYVG
ncbi:MAG: hypothetical protein QMD71_09280 [bacterium]|nr:hypothetical protein [bacterium]